MRVGSTMYWILSVSIQPCISCIIFVHSHTYHGGTFLSHVCIERESCELWFRHIWAHWCTCTIIHYNFGSHVVGLWSPILCCVSFGYSPCSMWSSLLYVASIHSQLCTSVYIQPWRCLSRVWLVILLQPIIMIRCYHVYIREMLLPDYHFCC